MLSVFLFSHWNLFNSLSHTYTLFSIHTHGTHISVMFYTIYFFSCCIFFSLHLTLLFLLTYTPYTLLFPPSPSLICRNNELSTGGDVHFKSGANTDICEGGGGLGPGTVLVLNLVIVQERVKGLLD